MLRAVVGREGGGENGVVEADVVVEGADEDSEEGEGERLRVEVDSVEGRGSLGVVWVVVDEGPSL